jgi:hypothetical protein
VKSKLCGLKESCQASAFASSLDAGIADQDVAKVCQEAK